MGPCAGWIISLTRTRTKTMPKHSLPTLREAPPIEDRPARFLCLQDVKDRLAISRSLLYALIKDPVHPFPAPVHIGRRSVWIEAEVEAYMRQVIDRERRRPPVN